MFDYILISLIVLLVFFKVKFKVSVKYCLNILKILNVIINYSALLNKELEIVFQIIIIDHEQVKEFIRSWESDSRQFFDVLGGKLEVLVDCFLFLRKLPHLIIMILSFFSDNTKQH